MVYCGSEQLKFQHEEIQEALTYAVREGGKIGDAAKTVAKAIGAHFEKEEKLLLPLLSLLHLLGEEKTDKSIAEASNQIDNMKVNLVVFNDEYKRVVIALKPLIEASKSENRPDYLRFAARLLLHARAEKEFIHRTAILIGNYLKIKKSMLEISTFNTSKVLGEKEKNSMEFIPEIYTRVYTLIRDRNNVAMQIVNLPVLEIITTQCTLNMNER
jgi:hypothetical protein